MRIIKCLLFAVAAALAMAGDTTPTERRMYEMGSFPVVLNELSKQFSRGQQTIDRSTLKAHISQLTAAYGLRQQARMTGPDHEVRELSARFEVDPGFRAP
jgi:hypothetical protein